MVISKPGCSAIAAILAGKVGNSGVGFGAAKNAVAFTESGDRTLWGGRGVGYGHVQPARGVTDGLMGT